MPRITASLALFLIAVTCIGINISWYPMVWEMASPARLSQSPTGPETSSLAQSAIAPQPQELKPSAGIPGFGWDSGPSTLGEAMAAEPISAYRDNLVGELASAEYESVSPISKPGYDELEVTDTSDWVDSEPGSDAYALEADDESFIQEIDREVAAYGLSHDPTDTLGKSPAEPVEATTSAKYGSSSIHQPLDQWQGEESQQTIIERPLVTVMRARATGLTTLDGTRNSENSSALSQSQSAVRRLPTVDKVWTLPQTTHPPKPSDSIPFYPTTGVL